MSENERLHIKRHIHNKDLEIQIAKIRQQTAKEIFEKLDLRYDNEGELINYPTEEFYKKTLSFYLEEK
jgi:hypothetical protein